MFILSVSDIGTNISHNLKQSEHIQLITNKAYISLGILNRKFKTWAPESFTKLRPQL